MFPGTPAEYNENQAKFCKWMLFYDMVYQAEDCPDDDVIADNRKIDKWFERKMEEHEQEKRRLMAQKKGVNLKSAYQHDNVIEFG